MKETYVVVSEWVDETESMQVAAFSTYEKAKQFFDTCIEEEKKTGASANSFESDEVEIVGDVYIIEEDPEKSYVLETSDDPSGEKYLHRWEWYEKEFYSQTRVSFALIRLCIDEQEIKNEKGGE